MIPIQYLFAALWFVAMLAFVYRLAIVRERAAVTKNGRESARARARMLSGAFRRPAEMGPIEVPWPEVIRMRLAIYADQIESDSDETPLCRFKGWYIDLLPYAKLEPPRERALFWLMKTAWEDSPTWALTV